MEPERRQSERSNQYFTGAVADYSWASQLRPFPPPLPVRVSGLCAQALFAAEFLFS